MGWGYLAKGCSGHCFSLLSFFLKLPILLFSYLGLPQTSVLRGLSFLFSLFPLLKKKKKKIPAFFSGTWETGEVDGSSHVSVWNWKPILF